MTEPGISEIKRLKASLVYSDNTKQDLLFGKTGSGILKVKIQRFGSERRTEDGLFQKQPETERFLSAAAAPLYKWVKTDLGRPEMIAGWIIGGILFVAFTFLAQKTLWIRLIGTDSALLQSALSLILMLGAFFLYYWTIRTLQSAEKKPLRQ